MLIVKLICLVLGTALAVLFILFTLRGRKEDWRIEGVPQKEFSDKELWAAGFAMQKLPMFSINSAVGKKMMSLLPFCTRKTADALWNTGRGCTGRARCPCRC